MFDPGISNNSFPRPLHLRRKYSKFLLSEKYIREAESRFRHNYGWPGVYGAVDGTHIRISLKGDISINRKGFPSIVCLCVADSGLRCSYYAIGYPGSFHDARIWSECNLLHDLTTTTCPAAAMEVQVG
jgi:hypothetical protein